MDLDWNVASLWFQAPWQIKTQSILPKLFHAFSSHVIRQDALSKVTTALRNIGAQCLLWLPRGNTLAVIRPLKTAKTRN